MANYTVPLIIGTLRLNNGRVATFYESQRGQYERALASGATPVDPPPADTTTVDGREVSTTANVPPPADTVTTGQSQSTPANNAQDDAIQQAPTSGGVGAGTSSNPYNTRGNDNNPPISSNTTQQALGQTFASQRIISQPNVLDQYASYTYCISWYILTPEQFNAMSTPNFNAGTWSLLIQSGGAPVAQRNQFFPNDYYLDDLEIETFLMGKGTGMSTNAMEMRFKVVEPNGITLIQNLYKALTAAYGKATVSAAGAAATQGKTVNANQTSQVPNWGAAQYCLTIEFYGYDVNGKLVAPARGQYTTNGQLANTSSQAVIKKYYPFMIQNLTFRTVANAIEYNIVASAIPYDTGASQSRGTIPFSFQLSGQTVSQILQGGAGATGNATTDRGARQDSPNLPSAPTADNVQTNGTNSNEYAVNDRGEGIY